MAIALERSGKLLVEVNNYNTLGETRVWIHYKEVPLQKFCDLVLQVFQERNYQYAAGKQFLERIQRMIIVPTYRYDERLEVEKGLPTLEDLWRGVSKVDLARCPIEVAGWEIDFYDFTLLAEYFLTNAPLMRRDPRLALLEKLKEIKRYA